MLHHAMMRNNMYLNVYMYMQLHTLLYVIIKICVYIVCHHIQGQVRRIAGQSVLNEGWRRFDLIKSKCIAA